jgi:polysaccharide deacetylase family protein (PEP-CTERM system associated)
MSFHLLSVDVEDWPQSTLDHSLPIGEDRVVANTHRLLELLDNAGVKATFFVQGQVAETCKRLALEIAQAGHEIATHGYSHRSLEDMAVSTFVEELHRSVETLRQQTGRPVLGHRAADFSISRRCLHLLEYLGEEGLIYDSSIFPVLHPRYGVPGAPRHPHRILCSSGHTLVEFPPATIHIAGMTVPSAGGGYLRLLPYGWSHMALRESEREGFPATCYMHPYELDPYELSRLPYRVPAWLRLTQQSNRSSVKRKLIKLLSSFRFITMEDALAELTNGRLKVGLELSKYTAACASNAERVGTC